MNRESANAGPRYRALIELLRAADTLWNASRAFFAPWNLGPSQFNVLNLLVDKPDGLSQTELSRALIMHRSNVTGLADRLERRGLLRRLDNRRDRRAYRLVLTPAGHKLMQEILPPYHAAAERVWGRLPVARIHQMAEDLAALTEQANSAATHAPRSA